jgi:hypothetical protein
MLFRQSLLTCTALIASLGISLLLLLLLWLREGCSTELGSLFERSPLFPKATRRHFFSMLKSFKYALRPSFRTGICFYYHGCYAYYCRLARLNRPPAHHHVPRCLPTSAVCSSHSNIPIDLWFMLRYSVLLQIILLGSMGVRKRGGI